MGSGKLDRRVQFQRATRTDDGFRDERVFAAHGDPVWAERQDISDGERWRAGEVAATVTTRFRVRHSAFTADLTPADRLVSDGRTYDIVGIKEGPGRRRSLELTCAARLDLVAD